MKNRVGRIIIGLLALALLGFYTYGTGRDAGDSEFQMRETFSRDFLQRGAQHGALPDSGAGDVVNPHLPEFVIQYFLRNGLIHSTCCFENKTNLRRMP